MSDAKTTYLENALLDHVLRGTPFTSPGNVYLGLFTSNPGESGGGDEVTGGAYARQQVLFDAAGDGATGNTNTLTFSGMPGVTITHIAIMDAASGGNMLYYKALPTSVDINNGNEVSWTPGTIIVTEA